MYPSTSFQKNLHIPETSINFSLNIFLNKLNILNFLYPSTFDNSCNKELLNSIDKCDETRAQISFLPLDFISITLDKYHIKKPIKKYTTLLEKKKDYLELLIKNVTLDKAFYEHEVYKSIPVKYFRKPYLNSLLTKTMDQCRLIEENPFIINNELNIKMVDPDDIIIRNENEWLSKYDLCNVIQPKIFALAPKIQQLVCFKPVLYLKNAMFNRLLTYSHMISDNEWITYNKNSVRFILLFILYKSHFTAVIIDKDVKTKNNRKSKFAYFFNSCGYNPNKFEKNKDYWFIDNTAKILNHEVVYESYDNDNNYNVPIEALTDIFKNKFGITNFVFNTFCIQYFDSECGIFSTMFLSFFLDMLNQNKTEDISINKMRNVYFNMINIGCDLTYSYFRGLYFFTQEDLIKNNIDIDNYSKSPYIFQIHNRKFIEYIKLYFKGTESIEKIGYQITKEKNDLYSKYQKQLL